LGAVFAGGAAQTEKGERERVPDGPEVWVSKIKKMQSGGTKGISSCSKKYLSSMGKKKNRDLSEEG